MLKKKLLIEITIITVVGLFLAIAYNIFNPDGLPFIPKDKTQLNVSDSLLFADFADEQSDAFYEHIDTTSAENNQLEKEEAKEVKKLDTIVFEKQISDNTSEVKLSNNKTKDGKYRLVTFEQMRRIVEKPDNFIIIDARHPDDYNKAHIPNAINIFPQHDEATFVGQLLQLSREKTIVIYCDGGTCDLSHEVANSLVHSFGFTRVFLYESGWEEWTRKTKSN